MITLKARPVGNSLGFTLPKEAADRLKIQNGDALYLTESPNGYLLTPYDPEFAEQMEIAEDIMHRYRNMLHELAK